MATRVFFGTIVAVALGGGLVLAALAPGIGLFVLLGAVIFTALLGATAFGGLKREPESRRTPELLGPGGPDDPTS